MQKKLLIPFALILMLILAACAGQQTAEPAAEAPVADQMAEESHEDDMDSMEEESHDEDMDDMEEESHDEDMDDMEEESHDSDMDDMDEESHEDNMDDMEEEGHDEDMDDMEEESHDDDMDSMEEEGHDDDMAEEGQDDMAAATLAPWQTVALTNAVSGEVFSLADFQGKTVFVEPMATWCGNCKKQQGEVKLAKEQLGDDVVFLALSLETNLPADQLAAYAQSNGFDWNYAVMNVELLEGLADQFGRSITNAPSTPHFVIRPDGSFGELSTGIHSAADIVAEIQAEQG